MSIEYAQGWDDAKAQVTTDNSQTLVNALVEIERLNDRLLMVEAILAGNGERSLGAEKFAQECHDLRQEVECLKAALDSTQTAENAGLAAIERKQGELEKCKAALRVALDALEYHTIQTRPIHSTDVAIATLREAL